MTKWLVAATGGIYKFGRLWLFFLGTHLSFLAAEFLSCTVAMCRGSSEREAQLGPGLQCWYSPENAVLWWVLSTEHGEVLVRPQKHGGKYSRDLVVLCHSVLLSFAVLQSINDTAFDDSLLKHTRHAMLPVIIVLYCDLPWLIGLRRGIRNCIAESEKTQLKDVMWSREASVYCALDGLIQPPCVTQLCWNST